MQSISTIGLDIAKSVFQVHGVDGAGQVVVRRQLRRRHVQPGAPPEGAGDDHSVVDTRPLGAAAAPAGTTTSFSAAALADEKRTRTWPNSSS